MRASTSSTRFGEWRVFGDDRLLLDVGKLVVPFTRNALQSISSALALDAGNFTFYMAGFNYYFAQQNFKVAAAYERIVPKVAAAANWKQKNTSHFVVQFQIFYF